MTSRFRQLEVSAGTAPTTEQLLALGALEHALAKASGDSADLLSAFEHTEEAIRRDPSSLAGLFNRGLIASDLGLCRLAARTWSQYQALDPGSEWTEEAAERQALLPCAAHMGAASESVPDELLIGALKGLLPQWIAARQQGLPSAGTILRKITEAGDRLRALNGDPAIQELAHELAAIDGPGHLSAVAAFTRGQSLYDGEDSRGAEQQIRPAIPPLRHYRSCLAPWAGVVLSGIDIDQKRFVFAETRMERLAQSPTTARSPYLLGRAFWVQGHAAARAGRLQTGYDLTSRAEEEFKRGGYSKAAAEVRTLRGEILAHLGMTQEAWSLLIPALRTLQAASGHFTFFHNGLVVGAAFAEQAGDYAVADAFLEEAAEVARAQHNLASEAEVLLTKARALQQRGAYAQASKDFRRVLDSIHEISPIIRARFEATALVGLWADPAHTPHGAGTELQSAVKFFAQHGPRSLQLWALRVTAERERRNSDLAASQRTLDSAIGVIRLVQADIEAEEKKIRQLDANQDLFDEAIDLAITENEPLRALRLLETVRRISAGEPARTDALKELRLEASGQAAFGSTEPVVLVFCLTPENFVWWRIEGKTVVWGTKKASPVGAAVRTVLGAAPSGRAKRSDFERLYAELLADALKSVPPGHTLVVVPDGLLQRVPFAALQNPETGVRLIEERAVSLRTSLRAALENPPASHRQRRAAWRVIAVGDPKLDTTRLPFTRLPGAAREAREVATVYGGRARLLLDKAATPEAIREALKSGEVLHLAAHATVSADGFRDALALAARPDGTSSGLTAATEILPASRSCQLAVLSGCSTLGLQPSRSGGLLGLARTFVAHGIPATLGTLWRVNDRVLPELMAGFHRNLLHGDSASEALRQAQLAYLTKNPDACCDWAALQLIGDLPAEPAANP